MGAGDAGALVDEVLPVAAQAGDGAQQVELAELLLNAVLGDAELAGDGQVRRVVLEQGVLGAAGPARQAAGPCLRQGVSPTGIDRPSSATLPRFFGTPPKK
jgi:hypothetical protein